MTQQLCPICRESSFTWSLDENTSPLTRWDCSACSAHFYEDESLEIGSALVLYSSSSIVVWCFAENKAVVVPCSAVQAALNEYQEWGEKLRTDPRVRIAASLPDLDSLCIDILCSIARRVEAICWDVASSVRDLGMSQREAYISIRTWFPFMSADNVARSVSQAMYYTLK
jgi:hypothetical protein